MQTTGNPTTYPTRQAEGSAARLVLARQHVDRAVLDGGWWPRTRDPAAEVPALVAALTQRYGPIRHVMLNSAAWADRPRRLAAGTREIRMGWFSSQDPALAIAITTTDDQLDLLVVPPATSPADAGRAMAAAADPDVFTSAAGILAALPASEPGSEPAGADPESIGVWDDEGGHASGSPRMPEAAALPAAAVAAVMP
ncbi:hypothetical protein Cs7R123_08170 [Catellatospora sp. TT07R-123]|uniref:DUF5994 family protein n=1 Tax=Catellatospora sp. TT07R-123 TaxID=2733863 RepID=UPI001B278B28|nr:DUF5994 family protein [Catellatospora sp. TT07R-123]GHJ43475.1 hypothetical protein Cs7R123_08170 [Catellatospora sp. TT07R-123]